MSFTKFRICLNQHYNVLSHEFDVLRKFWIYSNQYYNPLSQYIDVFRVFEPPVARIVFQKFQICWNQ